MDNTFILTVSKREVIIVHTRDSIITNVLNFQEEYFPFKEGESHKGLSKWAKSHGFKLHQKKRQCKTPDTNYKLHFLDNEIAFDIELPKHIEIDEVTAKELEDKLRDTAEYILSKLFSNQ